MHGVSSQCRPDSKELQAAATSSAVSVRMDAASINRAASHPPSSLGGGLPCLGSGKTRQEQRVPSGAEKLKQKGEEDSRVWGEVTALGKSSQGSKATDLDIMAWVARLSRS